MKLDLIKIIWGRVMGRFIQGPMGAIAPSGIQGAITSICSFDNKMLKTGFLASVRQAAPVFHPAQAEFMPVSALSASRHARETAVRIHIDEAQRKSWTQFCNALALSGFNAALPAACTAVSNPAMNKNCSLKRMALGGVPRAGGGAAGSCCLQEPSE